MTTPVANLHPCGCCKVGVAEDSLVFDPVISELVCPECRENLSSAGTWLTKCDLPVCTMGHSNRLKTFL